MLVEEENKLLRRRHIIFNSFLFFLLQRMSSSSYSTRSSSGRKSSVQRSSSSTSSTSTTTPPQTPTIRVTSPVPDAVQVVDIWDPELDETDVLSEQQQHQADEPVKAYSFRYKEEEECATSPADDGLKTVGESEEEEEEEEDEEVSQVSAVTQVPLSGPSPEELVEEEEDEDGDVPPDLATTTTTPGSNGGKPVKRVQFSRSLSLVPAAVSGVRMVSEKPAGVARLVGAGRRYSSLDGVTGMSRPLVMDFHPASSASSSGSNSSPLAGSGGMMVAMLSPTPESALESAQSPDNSSSGSGPPDQPQGLSSISFPRYSHPKFSARAPLPSFTIKPHNNNFWVRMEYVVVAKTLSQLNEPNCRCFA